MEGRRTTRTGPYLDRVSLCPLTFYSAFAGTGLTLHSKEATDKAYDGSVVTIISNLARQLHSTHSESALNVVFGTHNPESCQLVVDRLKAEGLALQGGEKGTLRLREDVQGKVFVAQLYGEFEASFSA